jgi:hypothetical protein
MASPARAAEAAESACLVPARGRLWAELMQRTFSSPPRLRRGLAGALRAKAGVFDALACPRCGGRLRLVARIEEAQGLVARHRAELLLQDAVLRLETVDPVAPSNVTH